MTHKKMMMVTGLSQWTHLIRSCCRVTMLRGISSHECDKGHRRKPGAQREQFANGVYMR